ncbi:uncharacterized protein N7477_009287 [Penicillium maclennaniae]|uniref:uncharacterized protein n=1 Tax=Penicillium maclennaniae TaxID=1343394 RepID=UPI002540E7AD|nr:uncharacterized protein N7477_009287 [Penicillium maclennaniae]KAJ5661671.1 hypothetical protein N7477_009287 [Penicillium maclennaniae]
MTVVEGSPLSEKDMERAFAAAGVPVDAVVIFLNPLRASGNPWAKFIGPPRLIADSTINAARTLRAQQPLKGSKPRLVIMNALGVGESYGVTPYLARFMMSYSNVGKTYEDHSAVNDEIEGNCGDAISWTLALAVGLSSGGIAPVRSFACDESGSSMFITRESCARWMVDVASGMLGDQFSNKRVIVSN